MKWCRPTKKNKTLNLLTPRVLNISSSTGWISAYLVSCVHFFAGAARFTRLRRWPLKQKVDYRRATPSLDVICIDDLCSIPNGQQHTTKWPLVPPAHATCTSSVVEFGWSLTQLSITTKVHSTYVGCSRLYFAAKFWSLTSKDFPTSSTRFVDTTTIQ